jgi:hypothetical protein
MRISIKKHNHQYLNRLCNQMECYDQTEVVNYLLTELKRVNYSFNSQVNLGINVSPEVSTAVLETPQLEEPGQHAQSGISYLNDPVIERLVALGLDEF